MLMTSLSQHRDCDYDCSDKKREFDSFVQLATDIIGELDDEERRRSQPTTRTPSGEIYESSEILDLGWQPE